MHINTTAIRESMHKEPDCVHAVDSDYTKDGVVPEGESAPLGSKATFGTNDHETNPHSQVEAADEHHKKKVDDSQHRACKETKHQKIVHRAYGKVGAMTQHRKRAVECAKESRETPQDYNSWHTELVRMSNLRLNTNIGKEFQHGHDEKGQTQTAESIHDIDTCFQQSWQLPILGPTL